jgi:Fe(3+) dicitrate transport protein
LTPETRKAKRVKPFATLTLSLIFLPAGGVLAAAAATESRLPEEVTIIGTREQARSLPGSAWVIDEQALEVFQYTDVHRVLAPVPGVYVVEEEGLGLRPNIGIRGSGTERSGKITLMEDSILMAPAPYADPSAYYFPTMGRMAGVEILKGAPLLTEGPYTVGGAINMLATAIPDEPGGRVSGEYGSYAERRLHASAGGSGETWGWLVETHQQASDGFQDIDRSNSDTGLNKQDYIARLRLNTPDSYAGRYQQIDLKLAYAAEDSNASYLGLTDDDFDRAAKRRYGLTELDNMDNEWEGASLGYTIELADAVSWNVTGYHNHFERDWFKVDRIDGVSIADAIAAANQGDALTIAQLDGDADTPLDIKHNARDYKARGVQTRLDWEFLTGGVVNDVQLGARWHRDDIDRFQPVEQYQQLDGNLFFSGEVAPTGSNNREETAKAHAYWLRDSLSVTETVDLLMVLRLEDIETERTEYATTDRTELAGPDKQRRNETTEWLPGIGATWQINDRWQLLGGVHQGMAPAGAGARADTAPELSTNFEAGFRYTVNAAKIETIIFYSDYENSVRNCSAAFPCENGEDSGTEQLGQAVIQGMELALTTAPQWAGLRWPVQISYTYTDAEITRNSDDGSVLKSDAYPYIPRNQLFLGLGVEGASGWSVNAAARYVSDMCIDFRCERTGVDNRFRKTDELFVLDLAASYWLTDFARLYARLDNVFDEQVIVSRSPAGARTNKPRSLVAGAAFNF